MFSKVCETCQPVLDQRGGLWPFSLGEQLCLSIHGFHGIWKTGKSRGHCRKQPLVKLFLYIGILLKIRFGTFCIKHFQFNASEIVINNKRLLLGVYKNLLYLESNTAKLSTIYEKGLRDLHTK